MSKKSSRCQRPKPKPISAREMSRRRIDAATEAFLSDKSPINRSAMMREIDRHFKAFASTR